MLENTLNALKNYIPPADWKGGNIFLLPEDAMRYIHQFIIENKLVDCVELGTGFGATSCVIVDALEILNAGHLTTIDRYFHQPVNVKVLLDHANVPDKRLEIVADILGYNWYLPEVLRRQTQDGICKPRFDFCLLDGAHEWEPDALAFNLIAPLIKPNGWVAIDDLNFCLRMIPNWQESHGNHSDKELDTYQMQMVYDLVVKTHPDFCDFHISHDGRIGWARKRPIAKKTFFSFLR